MPPSSSVLPSLTARLLILMLSSRPIHHWRLSLQNGTLHNLPGGTKAGEEKRRKKKTLQAQILSTWHMKAAVHVGVHEYHSRSKSGCGPGRDTKGLMTERIPKQEMKHPLSPWTNDVRISPVLSGLRMAHKMFCNRHPALKQYTSPKPGHRQRSLRWICVIYSFNSSQQMPLVACCV